MQASVRGMRASPFLGARRAQLVSSWSSSSSNGAAGDLEQLQCWARVAAFRSLLRCLAALSLWSSQPQAPNPLRAPHIIRHRRQAAVSRPAAASRARQAAAAPQAFFGFGAKKAEEGGAAAPKFYICADCGWIYDQVGLAVYMMCCCLACSRGGASEQVVSCSRGSTAPHSNWLFTPFSNASTNRPHTRTYTNTHTNRESSQRLPAASSARCARAPSPASRCTRGW